MIRHLTLKDVGPARELKFDFASRLNVLTGDNGLGKTFVLDVLWWVLTTTWAGEKAFPWRPPEGDGSARGAGDGDEAGSGAGEAGPTGHGGLPGSDLSPGILAVLTRRETSAEVEQGIVIGATWEWDSQEWLKYLPRRPHPSEVPVQARHLLDEATDRPASLVIYARIDGSYAVFDPYYVKGGVSTFTEAAIVLTAEEVLRGKAVPDPGVRGGERKVIRGLLEDWVSWQQRARSPEFETLCRVLRILSPPDEALVLSKPTRVHLRDRLDIPTLTTPYGVVPVTLTSAGVKRALSLAYLLVWAWAEHEKAGATIRQAPTRDVVLLIDEPELHQHPAWQRVFVPAVLNALKAVAPNAWVQMFLATHSPLVLASLESTWVEASDDLFVLERDGSVIRANEHEFVREGDVTSWLASSVFGGMSGHSRGAELAIDAAQHFMAHREREADATLRLLYDHLNNQPRTDAPTDEGPAWLLEVAEETYPHRPMVERVHDALKHTLSGHDEFWVHWTLVYRPSRRPVEGGDASR